MKASEIMTDVFGSNLVYNFYKIIESELYNISKITDKWYFTTTTDDLILIDSRIREFINENEVPKCEVSIYRDKYGLCYGVEINNSNWLDFDWDVSKKVEKRYHKKLRKLKKYKI